MRAIFKKLDFGWRSGSPLRSRRSISTALAAEGLPAHRPFKIIYATLYYDVRPSFVVDITEQFDRKLAALQAHASQVSSRADLDRTGLVRSVGPHRLHPAEHAAGAAADETKDAAETVAEDGTLESPFSGNLVEVCPTGVFTDKPYGPVNLDGAWNAATFLTTSRPVARLHSVLNLSGGVTYARTPGITGGGEASVREHLHRRGAPEVEVAPPPGEQVVALGREPLSGAALARDVTAVIYGAYLSAHTGRRVDLRPFL